jgi:hypothetical protein
MDAASANEPWGDGGKRSFVLGATMVLRAAGKEEQAEEAEDQHHDE